MRASSGKQALELLAELALRARPVALVLSDQRMPNMSGVEMPAAAPVAVPGVRGDACAVPAFARAVG
ncbi:MAG: hypothetical protein ACRDNZ_11690 [Streptosporangiaceae bacterium]